MTTCTGDAHVEKQFWGRGFPGLQTHHSFKRSSTQTSKSETAGGVAQWLRQETVPGETSPAKALFPEHKLQA